MRKSPTPIKECLVTIRLRAGESMRDMAAHIGCTPAYLGNVETGTSKLSEKFIQIIAKAYDLDIEEEGELRLCSAISAKKCLVDISKLSYEKRREIVDDLLLL